MIRDLLVETIGTEPLGRLDYAEVVDATTLTPVTRIDGVGGVLVAVAAFVGRARLIDNWASPCQHLTSRPTSASS